MATTKSRQDPGDAVRDVFGPQSASVVINPLSSLSDPLNGALKRPTSKANS